MAHSAWAQSPRVNSPILTIDSERLFSGSAFGRRVASEIDASVADLAAENRKIEAELSAEEQELTIKRETMQPGEFRVLADAFDDKVQAIRRQQDAKARSLSSRGETDRVTFLRAARPVLEGILQDYGASIILERSSVLLSSDAGDITDLAISRIDEAIGDGTDAAE